MSLSLAVGGIVARMDMGRTVASRITIILMFFIAVGIGAILMRMAMAPPVSQAIGTATSEATEGPTLTPSETIPPSTPLATLTPSRTLRPPPTFEPATPTMPPSATPSATPTAAIDLSVNIPGLHGAETATPSSTPGCERRDDWHLRYTVQRGDALERLAATYNTTVAELVEGNCLRDPNVIVVGQELRVPGDAHPVQPEVECVGYELITPYNGTLTIPGDGPLTFNWRGPRSPRNLIRVFRPNGSMVEWTFELRQNDTIDLAEVLPDAGTYTWYVYPLDYYYRQICPEGGPWTFTKAQASTATPTFTPGFGP